MKNKGFTIIELMIAVAIMGSLTAIAVPAYQAYLGRSKASEAMSGMAPYQKAVSECFMNNGSLVGCSGGQNGISESMTMTYGSLRVMDGIIVYTFGNNANPIVAGNTITFTPESSGGAQVWLCSSSLEKSYLPSTCESGVSIIVTSSPTPTPSASLSPTITPSPTPSATADATFNGVNFSECIRLAVDTSSEAYQTCISGAIAVLTAGTNQIGEAMGGCFPNGEGITSCNVSYVIGTYGMFGGISGSYATIEVMTADNLDYAGYLAVAAIQGIDLNNKIVCQPSQAVPATCPSGSYTPVFGSSSDGMGMPEITGFSLNN